jgi:parallel beta-helix repeat protein
MNKYALILPLVALSFFLGYFASSSQMEHICIIATVSTVFVAIAGFLLFLKHQRVGDNKRKRKTKVAIAFIVAFLFSALIGAQFVSLVRANMIFIPPILHIYINSDGCIEPSTVPIQRVGNVYTFMSNLTNCTITVQRNNIVIDGRGFTLSTPDVRSHTGITVSDRSNVTIKNVCINQFGVGILLFNSSNSIVTGNRINSTTCVYLLMFSSYNQIAGNRMLGDGYGVKGDGSFNNVTGNDFTATQYSVEMSCNNTIISQNYFENDRSIRLGDTSHYNIITENTMAGGFYGVILSGSSSNNLVSGNNITAKDECGIKIECSFGNTVYGNYLTNNEIGVHIVNPQAPDSRFSYSTNNTFYHNNFVVNTKNVHFGWVSTPNIWDNGEEGNYWSNYTGADLNGDSISETPYVIDDKNTDNYPLMSPVEISDSELPEVIPEFPTWTPLLSMLVAIVTVAAIYRQKLSKSNKRRSNQ